MAILSASMRRLSNQLDALTESYKQTLQSIHRIPRIPDGEELADLTITIRESLNSLSQDLKLLHLEIESIGNTRGESEDNQQKLRISVQAERLGEDLKNARATFRGAQIHGKRAGDTAKQREREERLKALQEVLRTETPTGQDHSTPTSTNVLPPRKKQQGERSHTEDDVLLDASGDVLTALRQTHALMSTELQRSQLAQEILNQSTTELEHLNGSYTDLDTMLKNSRGLVTQLMKSNKSDTWYLTTARHFLIVVLVWLIWRRWLWGPMWWLIWLPLKIFYLSLMTILSPFGLSGGEAMADAKTDFKVMPIASERPHPFPDGASQPQKIRAGRGSEVPKNALQDPSLDGSLSQKVGKMVELAEKRVRGDAVDLKYSDQPRNPKKRVMDIEAIMGDIESQEQGKEEQLRDVEKSEIRRDEL